MLLVLLFTALSASVSQPVDSVRATPKPGAVRPDTTLPAPTIAAPKQPAPEIVPPIRPVSSPAQRATETAAGPGSQPAPQPAGTPASAPSRPTEVVLQAAPAATPVSTTITDAKPSAPPASVVATPTSAAPSPLPAKDSGAKVAVAPPEGARVVAAPPPAAKADPTSTVSASTPTPTSVVASASVAKEAKVVTATDSKPAPEARPAAEIKPPVVAPADAVAAAAASPRNAAVSTTRVDPRTVVSVKSSERFEPLYAVPLPGARLRLGAPVAADSIVVYKRERTLVLFNRGVPVRTYFVALGSKPVGDKERAGDQRTPEGLFYVNAHNPASKFHLALRISYPDDAHRARAAALGVDPGGDIMIHGLPKEYSEAGTNHLQNDWTNGCVALSNQEIEEIWRTVPDGTPVQIKP